MLHQNLGQISGNMLNDTGLGSGVTKLLSAFGGTFLQKVTPSLKEELVEQGGIAP
jgi:hypothetical protein